MPNIPPHCNWFHDNGMVLQTSDGRDVRVIEFAHVPDDSILQEWAVHLRRHYISDTELVANANRIRRSKSEYLREFKFPTEARPGPSVRSGDFSEILVADYIEFLLNYYVPRTRYDRKPTQNESAKGTDILAFKHTRSRISPDDELLTIEVKGLLKSRSAGVNPFQKAINDSKKDFDTRLPLALHATRTRLEDRGELDQAKIVERFMNKTVDPYKQVTGAFFVCSQSVWSDEFVSGANSSHPNSNLFLLAFTGIDLMNLADRLYGIAHATA